MNNINRDDATEMPSIGLVCLLIFGVMLIIAAFQIFWQLPIQLALFCTWFWIAGFGVYLGHKYAALQQGIVDGIHKGMDAILVLIAVGALIGTWIAGGIVPNIIFFGLSIMSPNVFLPAAFVICAVTSLATGTSFGTVGTAGIAMIGIGTSFGMPLPLVAGAVISGAYVGDKLSPLSDTTVMTASLCRVEIVEHIKSMLYVSAPAALGALVLFAIAGLIYVGEGIDTSRAGEAMLAIENQFSVGWVMMLPMIIVIALLIMGKPSVPVIVFGAVLGIVWAVLFQGLDIQSAVGTAYFGNASTSEIDFLQSLLNRGGIQSMYGVTALIIFALGLGGLMERIGVLEVVCQQLARWATNPGRLTVSTLFAGLFGNLFGGAAYVSLVTASTMTEKNYDEQRLDRRVLSRNVEAGGTITTPMVPWSDGGVFMAATLGIATLGYLPYLWYHFLVIVISVLYGFLGIALWAAPPHSHRPPPH